MTARVWLTLRNSMVDSQVGLAQSQSQFCFAVWCLVPKKAKQNGFSCEPMLIYAMLVAKGDCWGVVDLKKFYG